MHLLVAIPFVDDAEAVDDPAGLQGPHVGHEEGRSGLGDRRRQGSIAAFGLHPFCFGW